MDSSGGRRPSASLGTDHTVSTGGLEATAAHDPSELIAGMMVGEYRIEGHLGSGGMGRVYSALHPVIAKRAAIKVLHPELSVNKEAVDRFVQEARSVNQIGHPNIVDVFSFGALPDGRNYFVMEWLRGESLRDRVKRERLAIGDVLQIAETITLPLEAAHDKGIVHRDLKPDNIFLVEIKGDRPQIKLLDFGIAKLMGTSSLQRTQTGNMLGTPAYISPEQARGEGVDHRTDIYALGAVMFELLTGRIVFEATNAADMIAQHLYQPPRSPAGLNPQVPPQLDALIIRMLAKAPDERPTLEQIRDELRACRMAMGLLGSMPGHLLTPPHGLYITPPPPSTSPGAPASVTVPGPRRRSRLAVILVSLVAAAGIGIGVFLVVTDREQPQAKPSEIAPTPVEKRPEVKAPEVQPAEVKPPAEPVKQVEEITAQPKVTPKPAPKRTHTHNKPTTTPPTKQGSGSTAPPPVVDPDAPM